MKTFEQKRLGHELKFEFKDDELVYTAKLNSSNSTRSYHYGSITSQKSEFTEKNDWYRNVGFIWAAIGAIQLFHLISEGRFALPFWLLLGLGCLGMYYFRQAKFTVIEADGSNILVLKNADHDAILETISGKRKQFLLEQYGKINFKSTLEGEIAKFKYLLKEKVITEDEFNENKKNVEAHFKAQPVPSPIGFV